MTQNRIDRMVAAATGESLSEIRSRGFSLVDPRTVRHDPETEPDDVLDPLVDWDELEAERHIGVAPKRTHRHVA